MVSRAGYIILNPDVPVTYHGSRGVRGPAHAVAVPDGGVHELPLAFRFTAIEGITGPPNIHSVKGSFVHRVLELLYTHEPARRTRCSRGGVRPSARRARARPRVPGPRPHGGRARHPPGRGPHAGGALLHHGGSHPRARHRARAAGGGPPRDRPAAGHHRPAGARGRRAGGDRLQDGQGPARPPRAGPPGRRPLLRLPVRAGARSPAGADPAHVPAATARSSRPGRPSARSGSSPSGPRPCGGPSARACETGDFKPRPSRLCPSCAFQDVVPGLRRRSGASRLGRPGALRPGPGAAPVGRGTRGCLPSPHDGSRRRGRRPEPSPASTTPSTPALERAPRPPGRGPRLPHRVDARRLLRDLAPGRRRVGPHLCSPDRPRPAPGGRSWAPNRSWSTRAIKRLFRRTRPTEAGDPRYPVRRPGTSSFPSGHASAGLLRRQPAQRARPRARPPLVLARRGGGHLAGLRAHPPRLGRRGRRAPAWPWLLAERVGRRAAGPMRLRRSGTWRNTATRGPGCTPRAPEPSPSPGTTAAPSPATPTSTCSTGWPTEPTGT